MDYMDEEERERFFTKSKLIKIVICIIAMGCIFLLIWFFQNRRSGSQKVEETKVEEEEKSVSIQDLPERPHIIDDVKDIIEKPKAREGKLEEIPKTKELITCFKEEAGSRICEFDLIDLPEIIEKEDVIDVRLSLADGRDYTVLSRKKVGNYVKKQSKEIVWLLLNEAEILGMESAISDLKIFRDARLYGVIFRDEDEKSQVVNYPVNPKSRRLIKSAIKRDFSLTEHEPIQDEELNEDRKKLLENGKDIKWKEAATYWEE